MEKETKASFAIVLADAIMGLAVSVVCEGEGIEQYVGTHVAVPDYNACDSWADLLTREDAEAYLRSHCCMRKSHARLRNGGVLDRK